MTIWERLPQERNDQKYFFSGTVFISQGVNEKLRPAEIFFIYLELQAFVKESKGIVDVQVYTDENNRRLYFVDSLNKSMIESGKYESDDNYCTLFFAEEY